MTRLLQCYRPLEVVGFCQSCSNFGINHSCPNFDFERKTWLRRFDFATLILTVVATEQLAARQGYLASRQYDSPTLRRYNQAASDDLYGRLSMYAFDQIKDKLNLRLLSLEVSDDKVVSIPPGSCTYCSECAKKFGKPCIHPEKLRYSLEALGFLVSELLQVFFDYQIDWQNRNFGSDFVTISALFSKEVLPEEMVHNRLNDIFLEL